MAGMGIINGSGFKKVDMKNRVYMKITREVQFDSVVTDNPFDSVFACMTILYFLAKLLGEQVLSIQPHQISYFVLRGWTTMSIGVAFMVGLCYKHIVL